MAQKIRVVRGTTNAFSLLVTDDEGSAYELETGELFRFGVKRRAEDAEYIIEKEITSADAGVDGEYAFEIERGDTINLPFGTYYYDIGLQTDQDYYNVIPASPFEVAKNITKWEAST